MKKFALKATAAAVALLGAGAAFAGTVTIGGGTAPTYAVEDLKPTTTITLPQVVYDTGVIAGSTGYNLTQATNYRVIFTLPNGMTWNGNPTVTVSQSAQTAGADDVSGSCAKITYAGQQANELAFGCAIVNEDNDGVAAPAKFTLASSTATAGQLATAGTEIKLTKVATQSIEGNTNWDAVDNTVYAKSGYATELEHLTQAGAPGPDTATVTDAEYTDAAGVLKPLNGFVAETSGAAQDAALLAKAQFTVSNNPNNFVEANGTAVFDMTQDSGSGEYEVANAVTFTVKDSRNFQGLATNGLTLDSDVVGATTKTLAANAATGNATLTLDGDDAVFPAQGGSPATFTLGYAATGDDSLGTTREIDLTGAVDGTGAKVALTDVNNWWKWGTNGMILKFAAISYKKNSPSWIQLTNYSTQADASYTATCYDTTSAKTAAGVAGVLAKNTTQRVELQDVCGAKTSAQSVEMVFATKVGNVNGAVVRKNASTGDVTYINASAGNSN